MPPDGDVARAVPLAARVANRLARHVRTSAATFRPKTPLVSFTFDDAPESACLAGADLLDAHGAKGTYYIAGDMIGTRTPHWRLADDAQLAALHARGHEIACHTYSHAFVPDLTPAMLEGESHRNAARLRAIDPELRLENFAYPYGFGSLSAKRVLSGVYATSRGIVPGLNAGRADRHYLRANPLIDGRMDVALIARLMDEAQARKGWLIFFGHDIAENASPYGCAPALLEAALHAAAERGITCVSIAEGLRRAA